MTNWLSKSQVFVNKFSHRLQLSIVKDIYKIAFPASIIAISSQIIELACLRIVGGFDATNYYITALFVPIGFFLLAIYESYRTPLIAFSSTLEARKELPLLSNYIVLICLLGLITTLTLLLSYTAFSKWIATILNIRAPYYSIFREYSMWMLGFAFIRCWSMSLTGVFFCVGKQSFAMYLALLSGLVTCGLTYFSSFYTKSALIAFAYSTAICSSVVCLIALMVLISKNIIKRIDVHFLKKQGVTIVREVYRIGAPIFVSYIVIFLSLFIFNMILSPFGKSVVSGFGIGYRIQSILILPAISIGIATAILINKCMACHLLEESNRILKVSMGLTFIIYIGIAIMAFTFRKGMVFLIVQDAEIYNWAIMYLYCVTPTYVALGPLLSFIMVLEQTGLGLKSLILNLLSFLASIILGDFLAIQKQDPTLVFWSIGVVNVLFFVLVMIRCFGFNESMFSTNRILSQYEKL